MKRAATALVLALLVTPLAARAEAFTTKSGTIGIFDVPTAEPLGLGEYQFALALRAGRTAPGIWQVAPLPMSLTVGLPWGLDVGLAMREVGLPGDPEPSVPLLTATAKYAFLRALGWRPGAAVLATVDRFNLKVETSLRVAASTAWRGPVRAAAYAGVALSELDFRSLAPVGGLAVLVRLPASVEVGVEGLRAASGWLVGGGVRWRPIARLGVSFGATWQPGELAPRFALGLSLLSSDVPIEAEPDLEVDVPTGLEASSDEAAPRTQDYTGPRPRFRLKIRSSPVRQDRPVHQQYEPEKTGEGQSP